ncbi:MAG TPA: HAMP domain-containing sensor histidine kinase [Thermoanaerobaculia bacterium]|nr:HAMP domain-containing sensor histidine kinase [Thermoanaerobaculia bacterium]
MIGDATHEILTAIAKLAVPGSRRQAAKELARVLGAEDLIVFVRDTEVGRLLPASGFPQTLPNARAWRDLLESAIRQGSASGEIKSDSPEALRVSAFATTESSVVALLGPSDASGPETLLLLLPLLETAFRNESTARVATAQASLARASAAQATTLAEKLDLARNELRRALDVAEEATRSRDLFLATISHELRTPLTSILGWLQLLRIQGTTAPDLQEALETIEQNAKAQSRLVEDILDHSRITTGNLRLEIESLDLRNPVREALEIVRPAAKAKQIELSLVPGEKPVLVSGDADRLRQVAWNLFSNAVKFTPSGGSVSATVEAHDGDAEIVVSDTGQGIETSFLPFVFDRFTQGDPSSTRTHAGLGLGLSIVRLLVELHGGSVNVTSKGSGRGTQMVVRLPLLKEETSSPAPVEPQGIKTTA